jgi:hypothetical protein
MRKTSLSRRYTVGRGLRGGWAKQSPDCCCFPRSSGEWRVELFAVVLLTVKSWPILTGSEALTLKTRNGLRCVPIENAPTH